MKSESKVSNETHTIVCARVESVSLTGKHNSCIITITTEIGHTYGPFSLPAGVRLPAADDCLIFCFENKQKGKKSNLLLCVRAGDNVMAMFQKMANEKDFCELVLAPFQTDRPF
jgi:hypothetical protein